MIELVINADDFGYSDGVCKAIVELLESGAISTTSFMVAAPDAPDRAKRWNLRRYRERVGVHLQLSGGRPLCAAAEAPSLYDMETRSFKPRASIADADPSDVFNEWKRQIEAVCDLLGGTPSHLDSHHGFHRLPQFHEVYITLASGYRMSARSGTTELDARMRAAKVPFTERVIREWTGRSLGLGGLHNILAAVASEPVHPRTVELATHPGYCDDYLRTISSLNEAREDDRTALELLAESNWLENNGFRLVTYTDVEVGWRATWETDLGFDRGIV